MKLDLSRPGTLPSELRAGDKPQSSGLRLFQSYRETTEQAHGFLRSSNRLGFGILAPSQAPCVPITCTITCWVWMGGIGGSWHLLSHTPPPHPLLQGGTGHPELCATHCPCVSLPGPPRSCGPGWGCSRGAGSHAGGCASADSGGEGKRFPLLSSPISGLGRYSWSCRHRHPGWSGGCRGCLG